MPVGGSGDRDAPTPPTTAATTDGPTDGMPRPVVTARAAAPSPASITKNGNKCHGQGGRPSPNAHPASGRHGRARRPACQQWAERGVTTQDGGTLGVVQRMKGKVDEVNAEELNLRVSILVVCRGPDRDRDVPIELASVTGRSPSSTSRRDPHHLRVCNCT